METLNKAEEVRANPEEPKLFRMSDLTYERGWNRKMIKTLNPDKIVKKNRTETKYFFESTVLEAERKFNHTPVVKQRPVYKKPVNRLTPDKSEFRDSLARKTIANCPPDVQRRIIHLQSLVPFHTPLDLGKLAVGEYNQMAIRRKKPLIGLSSSNAYIVDMIKIRYLERRIHEKLPEAHRLESLKAIRIVYPYMGDQIDAYIANLYRRPTPIHIPAHIPATLGA